MRLCFLKCVVAIGVLAGGPTSADAFYRSNPADALAPHILPAAMCGFSCRTGGRYIPGPPSVCLERGLNYCGSSREPPPPAFRGGGGPGIEFRFGDRGVGVAPVPGRGGGGGCRTVTIERDDGSVSRIRRCD